jgi:hypothetical protein
MNLRDAGLYLPSTSKNTEKSRRGTQISIVSCNGKDENSVLLALHKWRKSVKLKINGPDQLYKFQIRKDEHGKINLLKSVIPIKFDY